MRDLFVHADEALRLGRTEVALADYADLFDQGLGGAEPLIRRAELLRSLGRVDEGRADLWRVAAITPAGDGWTLWRLAHWSFTAGRPWRAAAEIREALRRDPDNAEFRVTAGLIWGALDWLDMAFGVLRTMPNDMTGWWGEVRRDNERRFREQRAAARAMLRTRRRADPASDPHALALALLRLGRLASARRLCEALMRASPGSFTAFEIHAWIVAREQGWAGALAFLEAVRFLHADHPDWHRARRTMAEQAEAPPLG